MNKSKKINNLSKKITKKNIKKIKKKTIRNRKTNKSKKMVGGEYYIEENTKKLKIKEGNQYWVINGEKLEAIKISRFINEINRGPRSGIYTWPWREDYPSQPEHREGSTSSKGLGPLHHWYTPDFDTIEDFLKSRKSAINLWKELDKNQKLLTYTNGLKDKLSKMQEKDYNYVLYKRDTTSNIKVNYNGKYEPRKLISTSYDRKEGTTMYHVVKYGTFDESYYNQESFKEDQIRRNIGTIKEYKIKELYVGYKRDEAIDLYTKEVTPKFRSDHPTMKRDVLKMNIRKEWAGLPLEKRKTYFNLQEKNEECDYNKLTEAMLRKILLAKGFDKEVNLKKIRKGALIDYLKVIDMKEKNIPEIYRFPFLVRIEEKKEENPRRGFATDHLERGYAEPLIDFEQEYHPRVDSKRQKDSFIYELIQGKRVIDIQIYYYGNVKKGESTFWNKIKQEKFSARELISIKKEYEIVVDNLLILYKKISEYRDILKDIEKDIEESQIFANNSLIMELDTEYKIFIDNDRISDYDTPEEEPLVSVPNYNFNETDISDAVKFIEDKKRTTEIDKLIADTQKEETQEKKEE
jgi:hypothetical protein